MIISIFSIEIDFATNSQVLLLRMLLYFLGYCNVDSLPIYFRGTLALAEVPIGETRRSMKPSVLFSKKRSVLCLTRFFLAFRNLSKLSMDNCNTVLAEHKATANCNNKT